MGKQWKWCLNFNFLELQNHCNGDCSHEIKRHLLLGRKVMTNLDSILEFFSGLDGRNICPQCRGPRLDLWVGKIPWRRKWQPTPVLMPRKFHGWRSLVGYSPCGHKEPDMVEWLLKKQHITKQRYYFTNKGPSGQDYGFSSSHVWMW